MRVAYLLIALLVASGANACCYTLSVTPRHDTIPVYTWYLNTLSQSAVAPTECAGTLHAIDSLAADVEQCDLLAVDYRPMGVDTVVWRHADLELAQRVLWTHPCIGFGPYRAGDNASSLLLHQLSDSWVRLQLSCSDSEHDSCVRFGLRLRDSGTPRLVSDEETDPDTPHCQRTPSPTPSRTPSQSGTPSHSPTPSQTPMPSYGAVFRVEATFESGIFIAMQFGLNYAELDQSNGERGAHFCSVPVLDAQRTHLITTLYADDESRRIGERSHSLAQWLIDQERERSKIRVTVVWQTGGWCRVTVDQDDNVDFVGCRIFVDDQVHETVQHSRVEALDARSVPVCGVVVAANQPSPSPSTVPVVCRPDRQQTRHDPQTSLVTFKSDSLYAEIIIGEVRCSDNRWHWFVERTSDLVPVRREGQTIACQIEDAVTRTNVTCGNDHLRRLVSVVGDSCATLMTSVVPVDECMQSISKALLLLE